MTTSTTHHHPLRDLMHRAHHWTHPRHHDDIRRPDDIGAYALTGPDPLATEWPATPPPPYLQARAEGMPIAALKLRATAELAAVFNY
ncbi:hypothetical protein [Nocardia sp. NPDC057455]|uniref:hypothetical protein n=1 Tax=Nocardia sp. NPDC057455 TaxID=3346138 RepID=UPI003671A9C5